MPRYVDGFVLPIPKKNLARYRRIARVAGKVWREADCRSLGCEFTGPTSKPLSHSFLFRVA